MEINKKKIFITTPIFYLNGSPHLGHAYTCIISDIIFRWFKEKSYDVYLQTGTDDHGEKNLKKAISLQIPPLELVNNNSNIFKKLLKKLGISNHVFFRTSNDFHKNEVKDIFFYLFNKKEIYFGNYDGYYCLTCEDYISQPIIKFNNNDKSSHKCTICFSNLKISKEKSFFLNVKKHLSYLINLYKENNYFILPDKIRKEIFNSFLNSEIKDLCVTRKNLEWGIKFKSKEIFDNLEDYGNFTIYVWFDALCNYINSEIGKKAFINNDNWEIIQIIGKDISRFHGIYWPIILKNMNLKLPNKIIAHGWIINKKEKMSKSKDNVIDPFYLLNKLPNSRDLMRAYSICKIKFLDDGEMDEKKLIDFYNIFFVNGLGNLISRVLAISLTFNNSLIPSFYDEPKMNFHLSSYIKSCSDCILFFFKKMDNYELTSAFSEIEKIIDYSNILIQNLIPWNIEDFFLKSTVINYLLNGIKIISFLLKPIIPDSSVNIFNYFNIDTNLIKINWKNLLDFNLIKDIKLTKKPHLFPRFIEI